MQIGRYFHQEDKKYWFYSLMPIMISFEIYLYMLMSNDKGAMYIGTFFGGSGIILCILLSISTFIFQSRLTKIEQGDGNKEERGVCKLGKYLVTESYLFSDIFKRYITGWSKGSKGRLSSVSTSRI